MNRRLRRLTQINIRSIKSAFSLICVDLRNLQFYFFPFLFLCGAATSVPVPIIPASPVSDPWVKYAIPEAADAAQVRHVSEVVSVELARYQPAFLSSTGLKAVWLARHLVVADQPRAAVVLQSHGILVIDIATPQQRNYLRHALHHEFYHLVELTIAGDFYFKDPKWAALNAPGVNYGDGGRFAQDSTTDPGALNHPAPGFIDRYAASGLEEDKAEVFACLMLPDESKLLDSWTPRDDILAQKAHWQRDFLTWWSTPDHAPGQPELFAALLHDDAPAVTLLLDAHPTLATEPAWDHWLPLHWAAAHSATRCLPVLAAHCPINTQDPDGWTALHITAATGDALTAHQLLTLGAHRTLRDRDHLTAAERAAVANHPALARLLEQ